MPCSKYKGAQRKACYATKEWTVVRKHPRRTRNGRVLVKKHSRNVMKRDKNLSYKQLRKKHKISRYGDDDNDGKLNYKDCRPWDRTRHGLFTSSQRRKTADDVRRFARELEQQEGVSQDRTLTIGTDEEDERFFE